jgi:glucokinase
MPEIKKDVLPVLAIDLGGSTIITAIICNDYQVMAKEYRPTMADDGPQSIITRIFSAVDHLLSHTNIGLSQLSSVSIAAAGAINYDKGVVTLSPCLPGWNDIPLKDIIREKYEVDTFLLNDASAAALGEHSLGAGRGIDDLIYLTVSTWWYHYEW